MLAVCGVPEVLCKIAKAFSWGLDLTFLSLLATAGSESQQREGHECSCANGWRALEVQHRGCVHWPGV